MKSLGCDGSLSLHDESDGLILSENSMYISFLCKTCLCSHTAKRRGSLYCRSSSIAVLKMQLSMKSAAITRRRFKWQSISEELCRCGHPYIPVLVALWSMMKKS